MSTERPALKYVPALATPVDAPPAGDAWFHQIKWDGYRFGLILEHGRARWISRHGKNWTAALPELNEAARMLGPITAVLDGELAVLLPTGVSSFQALQNALRSPAGSRPLVFHAFDVLHLSGRDLTKSPLEDRDAQLRELLEPLGPAHPIKYTGHIVGDGAHVFEHAAQLGVEGIVSKRRRSLYREGRTRDWLKSKCWRTGEFVVCGYRRASEHAPALSELLVGYYDTSRRFWFAGSVGTGKGFGHTFRAQLRAALDTFCQPSSPCYDVKYGDVSTCWVKPVVVVEVAYLEFTAELRLRHPSFRALRPSRRAEDVILTIAEPDLAQRGTSGR